MPVDKLTIQQFASRIKEKYPEYKDVNDTILTQRIVSKYPEYKDKVHYEAAQAQPTVQEKVADPNATLKLSDFNAVQQPTNTTVNTNELNTQHGKIEPTTEEKQVGEYGQNVAKENLKTRNTAVDNTLAREYKNLGLKVDKNSHRYQKDFNKKLELLQNGDIVQTRNTKTGEPTTTRGAKFFESMGNSLIESFKAPVQALKIGSLKGKDLADYLDELDAKQPEIPESAPSGVSGAFGEAAGGLPKVAGLFALNEGVPYLGTALASAEAELSSTGAHTKSMYHDNLKQLLDAGVPLEKARVEAANKAQKDAPLSATPDALMTAALGEMGANTKGMSDAATTFKSSLLKSGKSVGTFGVLGGAAGAAEEGIKKAQGYDVKMQDIVDNFGKEGFQYATMDAMFKIAPLVSKMPSAVQSAWKNYMTKVPEPMVDEMASKMGTEGEAIKQEIKDYKKADDVVPEHYSDEKRTALAQLIQQKNKLEEDNKTTHGSFKADNEKQIEQIDNAIETAKTTKNPHAVHVDQLTGESGATPKEYEDLSHAEQKGIVVPKEYGDVEVKETGEGENKKFTAKAQVKTQDGNIELFKNVKVEGEFSDKKKAEAVAEQALKQHYYENELADNLKPSKSEKQETKEPIQETDVRVEGSNEPKPTEKGGATEGEAINVGEGTREQPTQKIDLTRDEQISAIRDLVGKNGNKFKTHGKNATVVIDKGITKIVDDEGYPIRGLMFPEKMIQTDDNLADNLTYILFENGLGQKSESRPTGEITNVGEGTQEIIPNEKIENNEESTQPIMADENGIQNIKNEGENKIGGEDEIKSNSGLEEELHEASKPTIEFERIMNKDFAKIEDADKLKQAKDKHTDIFRRKKILDKLIDCL